MNSSRYLHLEQEIITTLKGIPASELTYYIVLLLAALKKEPKDQSMVNLYECIAYFSLKIKAFYQQPSDESLSILHDALTKLRQQAGMNSLSMHIKTIVLYVSSTVTGLLGGALGASIGLVAGFLSDWNFLNGMKSGFIVGLCFGLLIGQRTPDKMFRGVLESKLRFTLNSIQTITHELETKHFKEPGKCYDFFQNETKRYIIETYFQAAANQEDAFKHFLNTPHTYQICSTPSHLVDRKLDGSMGHHVLIRFTINGKIGYPPIEFGNRKDNPRWVFQAETRTVSGRKLFEMLTLDRVLQETHPMNAWFSIYRFQTGDNDCLTYVNKILIGTHQKPTLVKQFAPEVDTWLGTFVMREWVRFVKDMSENELEKIEHYFDGARLS